MENVILVIHLILAAILIVVVLMQRSEGGGLGIGGGGGGLVTGRGAATALHKLTWALAVAFLGTSIALTIIAAQRAGGSSVIERLGAPAPAEAPAAPGLPAGSDNLLPPSPQGGPVLPPPAN